MRARTAASFDGFFFRRWYARTAVLFCVEFRNKLDKKKERRHTPGECYSLSIRLIVNTVVMLQMVIRNERYEMP